MPSPAEADASALARDPAPAASRWRRDLVLLTLAGLAVRIGFLLLEPAVDLMGDESSWTALAIHGLAEGRRPLSPWKKQLIFYPPVYPYFIAVPYRVFGGLTAVKWLQVVMGALLVPAVGAVGCRAFSPRVGWIAAALAAFSPELVWFAAHFWSETLFMVFLWWAFERAFAADEHGRTGAAAVGGVLCGLAALTRETALPVAALVALWLAWGTRVPGARRRGCVFLFATVLTVVPWTVRNWIVFDAFVPVSTFGALNVWQGNAGLPREELYRLSDSVEGPIAQYRLARGRALEAIARRQPAWFLEKLWAELPNFWEPWSEALSFVENGAYGTAGAKSLLLAKAVVLGPYLAVLGLGLPALALFPWTRPRALLGLFFGYYVLIHIVTYGAHRFHVPVLPLLFVWAAAAFTAWRRGELRALPPRRRALVVALALLTVALVLPGFMAGQPAAH